MRPRSFFDVAAGIAYDSDSAALTERVENEQVDFEIDAGTRRNATIGAR